MPFPTPRDPIPLETLDPLITPNKSQIALLNTVNASVTAYNAFLQKKYLEKLQEYETYLTQKAAYLDQISQSNQQQGQPTAFIELKAQPGDITVEGTNYKAETKVNYNYKGTMINGEATGILSTKASLTKIE